MTPTIRLGRLFGIEIGFNWSLIFIFVLIAGAVATQWLPSTAPGHAATTYWLVGLAGAILFYASLIAHEMSHALVARRNGVKVAGITLWLFGGVSRLDGEPPSAGSEALIAGVGPLTSLGVAAIAFGVAYFTSNDLVGRIRVQRAHSPLEAGRVLLRLLLRALLHRQRPLLPARLQPSANVL